MKKKVNYVIALVFVTVACLFGEIFGLTPLNANAAASVGYATDIFSKSSGITMETTKDLNGEKCLSLNAHKDDSYVVLNEQTVGKYVLEFTGSFKLCFESDFGEFTVNVTSSGKTIFASVEIDGEEVGIYYKNGIQMGLTEKYNAARRYTDITVGERNFLTFDAETMCVYISNGKTEVLVWDLSQNENDAKTINSVLFPFDSYSVTLKATKENGNICLYSAQDCVLGDSLMIDKNAPQVYAIAYSNMKSGVDYSLPVPSAYDLFDGEITDINVTIKKGSQTVATVKYQEGMVFETPSAGSYEIIYSATDKSGKVGKYSLEVKCLTDKETYEFTSNYTINNDKFGVGSTIALPDFKYESNYACQDMPCLMTVKFNDEVLENYNGVLANKQTLKFDQAGTYTVVIKPIDVNAGKTQTYTFVVSEELPKVDLANFAVKLGDVLELPQQTITFDGKTYNYDNVVYYPDGIAYKGESFNIDQAGLYTVEYRFVKDNVIYEYSVSFVVNDKIYSFNTDTSSAYLGETTYDTTQSGLNIFLKQGDIFTYNKVIDMSDNTKDVLLLELLVTPLMSGTQELQEFQVIFTDIYDSSNYITIDFLDHKDLRESCYAKIAPAGEELSGYSPDKSTYYVKDWGTFFRTSLYGLENVVNCPIKLWFDSETKEMFVSHGYNIKRLISDLDDYGCYGNIWEGFTTGECLMTIKGVSWKSAQAGFFLKTVDGEDVTSSNYYDTEGPSITVDLIGYTEDNLPLAVVGLKYPLFSGNAMDSYTGKAKLHTEVYLDYGKQTQKQISVYDDAFTPYTSGKYTIVYSAYDNYGNRSEKLLIVNAVNQSPAIDIDCASSDGAIVGIKYTVPTVSVNGGCGKIDVVAYVEQNGSYVVADKELIFETAGDYKIKYVATDYLGNEQEFILTVTATYADTPVFVGAPDYSSTLLSGKVYKVKDFTAKYYSEEVKGEKAEIKVYLVDKNGKTLLQNSTFIPEVENSGDSVQLIYEAGYGEKKTECTYNFVVNVVNNEPYSYFAQNYFNVSNNGSVKATEDGVVIGVSSSDSDIVFAQNVVANGFKIVFDVNAKKNSVGAIVIKLYDSENRNNALKFKIINTKAATSYISVNDGAIAEMKGSFVGTSDYLFELSYNNDTFIVKDADSYSKTMVTNANGDAFNGFTSGLIYFTIEFEDVTGETEIIVKQICNQNLNNETNDLVDPQAALIGGEYAKNVKKGEIVTVKGIVFADVLSLNTAATYSVTYNGKLCTSTTGVKLSSITHTDLYSFTCSDYGNYLITYSISDDSGNTYYYAHTISVIDDVLPEIIVSGKISNSYKNGKTITLPSATATDNIDEKVDIMVAVYLPDGLRGYYKPGDKVTFTQKGAYTIKYIAVDTAGNMAEVVYITNVK